MRISAQYGRNLIVPFMVLLPCFHAYYVKRSSVSSILIIIARIHTGPISSVIRAAILTVLQVRTTPVL